ncbi:hypothetical protein ASPCADRAFT_208784 [Aspergillus carbonarius ITEM 5010]|uniref:Uncharacterized protein n=1 Tax=Aspergillus carbonarius (strain ITEM 5010) TaxID=602072 RepID=A0A1R3RIF3_ASPC5|nr:hypothetical protein ASPCADRAFT_208784 [Aspergillus carbonarius ITEM 5010]
MNWTGGRLRRHSNIHARNKKQPFRKPRSTTEVPLSTRFRAPSPLKVNRIRASDPGDQSPQNPDQQDQILSHLLRKPKYRTSYTRALAGSSALG